MLWSFFIYIRFEDANLTNNKKYYYAAFSYSDHDVYNRDESTKAEVTPNTKAKVTITFTANEAKGCAIKATKGSSNVQQTVDNDLMCTFELDEPGDWSVGGKKVKIEGSEDLSFIEDVYGYDLAITEADTERSITYPTTVTNADYAPVPECGFNAEIEVGEKWMYFVDEFFTS